MTLQWSPESIHDLIALRAHISADDPAAAKRVTLHILYYVEDLLFENPQLGHPGRVPGTRELVIPKTPFVVPYRVRNNALEILRVCPPLARTLVATGNQLPPRVNKAGRCTSSFKIRDVRQILSCAHGRKKHKYRTL